MPHRSQSVYLLSDKDGVPSSEQLLPVNTLPHPSTARSKAAFPWSTALNIILFTAALLFFLETMRLQRNFETDFFSSVSSYSPAASTISYHSRFVNFSSEEMKIYQGNPTPEMTAAWDRISDDIRPMRIPLDMLPKLNIEDDENLVKFPEEHGGGAMATMGVMHHLHCLNLLRKSTYREYYKNDRFFTLPAEELREHLDHCIEVLRQAVTCSVDVTVITYDWKGDELKANSNKVYQCRRFDDVIDWAYKNAVHVPAAHMSRNGTVRKHAY